jgi:hypothetical protein
VIRGLLLAGLLAGCNMVLGLDEGAHEVPDADRDGVEDSRDNCPFDGNVDQADSDFDRVGDACDECPLHRPTRDADKDGLDDACDPCPLGPQHDEDGDTELDACDYCPGEKDQGKSDDDADALGNDCDQRIATVSERVIFEAFAPPRAGWTSSVAWVPAEDGESITPSGTGEALLIEPTVLADSPYQGIAALAVATGVPGSNVAIGFRTERGDFLCGIRCAPTCELYASVPMVSELKGPISFTAGPVRLTMKLDDPGLGRQSMTCGDDKQLFQVSSVGDTVGRTPPILVGTPGTIFRWVDVQQ